MATAKKAPAKQAGKKPATATAKKAAPVAPKTGPSKSTASKKAAPPAKKSQPAKSTVSVPSAAKAKSAVKTTTSERETRIRDLKAEIGRIDGVATRARALLTDVAASKPAAVGAGKAS